MVERPRPDQDAELADALARARQGDHEAFGRIWSLLSPRVAGYVRTRGVTSPDDVTSEVFLAAFTSLRTFQGGVPQFRSWLFTIAHHKAVDELRRRVPEQEYDAARDARRTPSAEDSVLAAVTDPEVARLLGVLTEEQREVLLLRALGDLSIEQVAEATGRTQGAVKQLYHRAVITARRASQLAEQDRSASPVTSRARLTMTET